MRALLRNTLSVCACVLVASSASADVTISISDGYVSVDAKNATVRQILSEWARVGQTRIVNAERVTGAPLTLRLIQVPEAQALDIVLRSVSGYMAAPRAVPVANASRFDRILVMPTSTAPRVTTPAPQQAFQPQAMPMVEDADVDDQGVPPPAQAFPGPGGMPPPRGQTFPQYPVTPAPQVNVPAGQQLPPGMNPNQAAPPPPQYFPGSPIGSPVGAPPTGAVPAGVATPGMVVQPPPPSVPPEPQD